jgi:hypothetical protein
VLLLVLVLLSTLLLLVVVVEGPIPALLASVEEVVLEDLELRQDFL